MRLLIDIDGVICTYDFPALTKKYFGVSVPNNSIWTYSLEESLGVSTEEVVAMFEEVAFEEPKFTHKALESLGELVRRDHYVWLYSNRIHFMGHQLLSDWVWDNNIPHIGVVRNIEKFKDLWGYVDYHIDDSPTKLMNLGDFTNHKLLFSRPWNCRCLDIQNQLTRVMNWDDIMEILKKDDA